VTFNDCFTDFAVAFSLFVLLVAVGAVWYSGVIIKARKKRLAETAVK
jgi:hypothetical protein